VRFTQPPGTDVFYTKEGIELPSLTEEENLMTIGATETNLPPPGELSRYGDYFISGNIIRQGGSYVMHMEIMTSCSRKTVASANVSLGEPDNSEVILDAAAKAVAQMNPLSEKIKAFELKERADNNDVALGTLGEDDITIQVKKSTLSAGETTELQITMKDCDGEPLSNREIVFGEGNIEGMTIKGTIGGTVTPLKVITDGSGKANARFKMGTGKTAIINAHHLYRLPTGCNYAKVGSAAIGGGHLKVIVDHEWEESKITYLQKATLPGVKKRGGNEQEFNQFFHKTVLFHYPSEDAVKKGNLVLAEKDGIDGNSKTVYVVEAGMAEYSSETQKAELAVMIGDIEAVRATEEGTLTKFYGFASLKYPSEVFFFKGDNYNPATFLWSSQYPASNDGIVSSAMTIDKCDPRATWEVREIKDPKSLYKTEYFLKLKVDPAKEFAEANKIMGQTVGISLGEGLVEVSGYRSLTVRIYSTFPPFQYDCK
jgi:hypothetical protein